MRILSFETSAKSAGVALVEDGKLLAESYQNMGQTHSRTILAMAEDMLRQCDFTVQDVDAVACASGPGSFTGIRIGLAAAKGFAWGREIPLYGVSTLKAMAYSFPLCTDGYIIPAMDARRSQVYTAVFQKKDGVLTQVVEDCAISLSDLSEILAKLDGPKILVGDGAVLCSQHMDATLAPEHARFQRASGVALAAFDQETIPAGQVEPNYLRLSQAEREKLQRTQGANI